MPFLLCIIMALFMGFSFGTVLFMQYQHSIEKDLASLAPSAGSQDEKEEIPENL